MEFSDGWKDRVAIDVSFVLDLIIYLPFLAWRTGGRWCGDGAYILRTCGHLPK